MKKPNYLLYFTISLLGVFVCLSFIQKFELNKLHSEAIQGGYAEMVDNEFVWKHNIL
jgi:hypothetical protein